MFPYADPTSSGALEAAGALPAYRQLLHGAFRQFGKTPRSGLTIPEAFDEVQTASDIQRAQVTWIAFPRASSASAQEIDTQRFRHQDEYVEWRTVRDGAGRIGQVTFTTEFTEYYEALAAGNPDALLTEIHRVSGQSDATFADVFGANFDPRSASAEGRARRLVQNGRHNPWNNGEQSILFLSHPSSTLGALLNLAAACGIPTPTVAPSDMCASVGGACVNDRNSDPAICAALQRLAQDGRSFTFVDPVGVTILRLEGIWKRAGHQIDINTSEFWRIERNGRRATLNIPPDLTIVDTPITSGTQVAARLIVGAEVIFAADDVLPEWSRMGQESSRMFTD